MKKQYTVIIEKDDTSGTYTGQLEEYPGVISEADTIDDLIINIKDALKLYLEAQKELMSNEFKGKKTIRRKLLL